MRGMLREMTSRKLRVVVALQTPMLMSDRSGALRVVDAPDCLYWHNDRHCSMSLLIHRRVSEKVNHVLETVAAEFVHVKVLDPAKSSVRT